jgi:hypothetical protein
VDEATAGTVVEMLRARRIFASVNRRAGVYNVGVRIVIPDGREAIWDNDGAAGLEAMVLRDGVLVGFVPEIPGSDELEAAAIAEIIAAADYDAPPAPREPAATPPTSAAPNATPRATPRATPPAAAPPAAARPTPSTPRPASWRDRLRRTR